MTSFQARATSQFQTDPTAPREIPRRRLVSSGVAQQRFRRAILEAAAEISADFTDQYWKEVINGKQPGQKLPPPSSNHLLKQRFIAYLNTTGKYLVLREHLKQSVAQIMQQRSTILRPSGFKNHRDFQNFIHDVYNFLIDEIHETLRRTILLEGDPLEAPTPKSICTYNTDSGISLKELQTKTLLRDLLFFSEELFLQGEFDGCHRLHLERICRSGEDASCWLDFALMWLSRGEDRMAEVAVREALAKDPNHIHAILVAGIIAVENNDPRGVAVLASALEQKPLSPELLVIMAFAHAAFGQKEDSDYFFRKAAYVHKTLMKQDKEGLDAVLDMLAGKMVIEEQVPLPEMLESEMNHEEMYGEEYEGEGLSRSTGGMMNVGARQSMALVRESEEALSIISESEFTTMKVPPNPAPSVNDIAEELPLEAKAARESMMVSPKRASTNSQPDDFYTRRSSMSRNSGKTEEALLAEKLRSNSQSQRPKYDAIPDISELNIEDAVLPPLRPSLMIPWDATEFSDKLAPLSTFDVNDIVQESELGPETPLTGEDGPEEEEVSDEALKGKGKGKKNKGQNQKGKGGKGKSKSVGKPNKKKSVGDSLMSIPESPEDPEEEEGDEEEEQEEEDGQSQSRASAAGSIARSSSEKRRSSASDKGKQKAEEPNKQETLQAQLRGQNQAHLEPEHLPHRPSRFHSSFGDKNHANEHELFQAKLTSGTIMRRPTFSRESMAADAHLAYPPRGHEQDGHGKRGSYRDGNNARAEDDGSEPVEFEELFHKHGRSGEEEEEKGAKPDYAIRRLGSELIWTAQLLLQLRMFDMLDGVLTRELYASGKRTLQFLYLRAISLYLRRCQEEAIPILEEALQIEPEMPALWMFRGHCFYELGDIENATLSYEFVLKMPVGKENRHLLYLRYGSLCVDNGNLESAKRVFLYGIQKYATPYLWMAVGMVCYSMEDYEQAEAAFAEANRLDNANPNTWGHLSMANLALDRQALAEQTYKWAIRFGLKKGKLLDEIKRLQQLKGFGDPSIERTPNCIPHDYYVRRVGRVKPFDAYREALTQEAPSLGKKRFDNTETEEALRLKLQEVEGEATYTIEDEEVTTDKRASQPESVEVEQPQPPQVPRSPRQSKN